MKSCGKTSDASQTNILINAFRKKHGRGTLLGAIIPFLNLKDNF